MQTITGNHRLVYGYEDGALTAATDPPQCRVRIPVPAWLFREGPDGVEAFIDDLVQELDELLNWPPTYPELEGERPQLGAEIDREAIRLALPAALFGEGGQHAED